MATDSKPNTQNKDEIDLLYVFIKLGEFIKQAFQNLLSLIGFIFVLIIRNWYYFAIAVILAALTAFILDKVSEPYYHSSLTIRSNTSHNQPIMSKINRIGVYANTRNFAAISEELNIGEEEARKIKGLETFWYYDIGDDGIFDGIDTQRKFLSDTSIAIVDSVFSVHARVYNIDFLDQLENSLVQYLKEDPILKGLNNQRLTDLNAQLNQIEYEIEKLDSLQKREYYTNPDELRQKEGQIVFTSEKEVRMYHPQMFGLLRLKQDCERDLNLYKDVVTILEGFSIPIEPDNGTIPLAKKVVWYYLGFALLLAIVIKFRKKIWGKD